MAPHKNSPPDGPSGSAFGRGPREDRAAEAPFGAAGGASGGPGRGGVTGPSQVSGPLGGDDDLVPELDPSGGVDPELVDDLGAEFELRGLGIETEIAVALAEAAEMRDKALRAQAEFDNFRKRVTREREDERKRATERLVEELLPAIDNLERAIEHTTADNDINHLIAGVTSVHTQVVGILGKQGVTVIDPTGQPFDPNTQHAVSQLEDPSVPEGTVVAAFQKGYEMGGRVIRPAMVVVSTGGPRREE
jgi:molecular chaperone GrpE